MEGQQGKVLVQQEHCETKKEIERRFLVRLDALDAAYPQRDSYPYIDMDVAYAHDGVRYRKEVHSVTGTTYPIEAAKQFTEGSKFFASDERSLGELPNEEAFVKEKERAQCTVQKRRLLLPYTDTQGTYVLEADIFPEFTNSGFCIVEVEFGSDAAASAFVAPHWLGSELTRSDGLGTKRIAEMRTDAVQLEEKIRVVRSVLSL